MTAATLGGTGSTSTVVATQSQQDEATINKRLNAEGEEEQDDDEEKELHIAPMMGTTTKEFRQLMRILSRKCVLWTEMIVDTTIIHTSRINHTLGYDGSVEHPVVCQLGGYKPNQVYDATKIIASFNYDEINLNCGCPSDRVADGQQFGAVLMKTHKSAAAAVEAMVRAVDTNENMDGDDEPDIVDSTTSELANIKLSDPQRSQQQSPKISIKCRVGVDEYDTLDDLVAFIEKLSQHTQIFYLHARKAVLGGLLSPHENRCVPPLNYPRVYKICQLFPHCTFYINGGVKTLKDAKDLSYGVKMNDRSDHEQHMVPCKLCKGFENGSCVAPPMYPAPKNLRGVMLGRVCASNPMILWDVDRYFYNEPSNPCKTRKDVFDKYLSYLDQHYPRRCCDRDPAVTSQFNPHPKVEFEYDFCPLCYELYNQENDDDDDNDNNRTISIAPKENYDGGKEKIKVMTISQAVKPILHVFHGMMYAKKFSHEIEVINRNAKFRNCGPSSVIRRALRIMPEGLLTEPLVPADKY
mmetsp:Transcript_19058/g.46051  ORF Transcript_19058/g.46051 Transcript_19058/m.46051 type:complete len:523 (+) Transcript_19058:115-1683(+)